MLEKSYLFSIFIMQYSTPKYYKSAKNGLLTSLNQVLIVPGPGKVQFIYVIVTNAFKSIHKRLIFVDTKTFYN